MNQDLTTLLAMRLQEDVKQQAALEILTGKSLDFALRHARAEVARQLRPSGFISFDEEEKEGQVPLAEHIAAPEQEPIERWRVAGLDRATETLLASMAAGTAAIAKARGVTQRRAQQIVAKNIAHAAQGNLFDGEAA